MLYNLCKLELRLLTTRRRYKGRWWTMREWINDLQWTWLGMGYCRLCHYPGDRSWFGARRGSWRLRYSLPAYVWVSKGKDCGEWWDGERVAGIETDSLKLLARLRSSPLGLASLSTEYWMAWNNCRDKAETCRNALRCVVFDYWCVQFQAPMSAESGRVIFCVTRTFFCLWQFSLIIPYFCTKIWLVAWNI